MTGTHLLHRPGTSAVHRLPPHVKIIGALAAVACVVATPRTWFWLFALDFVVLAAVWSVAAIPPGWLARRAAIELPFVLFAALLPFISGGPRTEFLGVSVSVDGALAGWNVVVKGTLGLLITLTLAATTHPRDLIVGLQRLRVPSVLTTIASMMLRYVDVVVGEARRMRTARLARGDDPRWLSQTKALAASIGTLFVRSYERGERVHRAMIARGWNGALPVTDSAPAGPRHWLAALTPALAMLAALGAVAWTP